MMAQEIESNQKSLIVFMGASVMDLISYAERFPNPGETVSGSLFLKGTGGKAANACVMCSRLGIPTAILAKIGDDAFGKEMIENFNQHNINIDHLFLTKEIFTSTAAISVNEEGQNSIIYVPGPSNLLTPKEIEQSSESIFSGCKLFVSTFECTPSTLQTALSIAKEKSVKTLVNAAPPFNEQIPNEIYNLCDLLCLNESEASIITGVKVDSVDDGHFAMINLLNKGCGSVILTMGSLGALYLDANMTTPLHVKIDNIETIKPVDTTGAGDAFVGSFAYYTVSHPELSIEEKLKCSCKIASLTVMNKGTQSSYPWRHQLPDHLFE